MLSYSQRGSRMNDHGMKIAFFTCAFLSLMAISKTGNGESENGERGTGNGERGTGNGERGISKIGNI